MIRIRRRWLVNYSFSGGTGRVFLTTKRIFMSEALVKQMDQWLRENAGVKGNPVVTSAFPIGFKLKEPDQ